ncbi:glycoside hydrolase superfamily [Obelidium mucronatum]|nr:glycoside hydrolase superfamily [Obelidium mucronatum]
MSKNEEVIAATPAAANKRRIIIIASVVLVLALAGGLGAYFGTRSSSSVSTPTSLPSNNSTGTTTPGKRFIGYWGQNAVNNRLDIVKGFGQRNATTVNQLSLDHYCNTKYYDVINLAFVSEFGGGDNHFTINLAMNGLYKWDGTKQTSGFDSMLTVGTSIKSCQQAGVKVILSLGGDLISNYSFAIGDGKKYANLFYNAFLGGPDATVKPFGADIVLDGIELDIEKNPRDVVNASATVDPSGWTNEMVDFVVTLRALKPSTIIAAVPQCSLAVPGYLGKDKNMGDLLAKTPGSFDYIIVQYYNNIECTYPFGFNYNTWTTLFPGKIYLGLPGGWASAISGGFLSPNDLQAVYDSIKNDKQFGGISVYDVSSSNPPAFDFNATNTANPPESHYSETIYNLLKGKTVGSGRPPQGEPLLETSFGYRCGGTWVHANATCSNKACNPYASTNNTIVNGTNVGTGCGEWEQCFRFLAKC